MQFSSLLRPLHLAFAFFDLALLWSGVSAIIYAGLCWDEDADYLRWMAISKMNRSFGTFFGISALASFALSLIAVLRRQDKNKLFIAFNWSLVFNISIGIALGTSIWISSLRQRYYWAERWPLLSPDRQVAVQDEFSCCGYFNGTNPGLLPSSALKGFCADPNFAQEQRGCIDDVTLRTAHLQEVVFTTIYGVVGLMTCLLLTSLCIIDERKLTVRFAKIDEKRGGGGFV